MGFEDEMGIDMDSNATPLGLGMHAMLIPLTRTRSLSESESTASKMAPLPAEVRPTASDDSVLKDLPWAYSTCTTPAGQFYAPTPSRRPASLHLQTLSGFESRVAGNSDVHGECAVSSSGSTLSDWCPSPLTALFANRGDAIEYGKQDPALLSRHILAPPALQLASTDTVAASSSSAASVAGSHSTSRLSTPALLSPRLAGRGGFDVSYQPPFTSSGPIIPRRSRGLDFSRAATSLHHTMSIDQSSPDSSPTAAHRGSIAFSCRNRSDSVVTSNGNEYLCGVYVGGHQDRSGGGLAKPFQMALDSSDSSEDDDMMDEDDFDEPSAGAQPNLTAPNTPSGPSMSPGGNNLLSYRHRRRKQPQKRLRGPFGISSGFSTKSAGATGLAQQQGSPGVSPHGSGFGIHVGRGAGGSGGHVSGSESEESYRRNSVDKGRVTRRAVTRRHNLLVSRNLFSVCTCVVFLTPFASSAKDQKLCAHPRCPSRGRHACRV